MKETSDAPPTKCARCVCGPDVSLCGTSGVQNPLTPIIAEVTCESCKEMLRREPRSISFTHENGFTCVRLSPPSWEEQFPGYGRIPSHNRATEIYKHHLKEQGVATTRHKVKRF